MAKATITKIEPIGKPYASQGMLTAILIKKGKRKKIKMKDFVVKEK